MDASVGYLLLRDRGYVDREPFLGKTVHGAVTDSVLNSLVERCLQVLAVLAQFCAGIGPE